jgi:hypothetical protein
MKDGIPVMDIPVVRMPDPVRSQHMEFDGTLEKTVPDAYPGIPEIRALIPVPSAGRQDLERMPRFGKKTLLIEIAKTPDEMQ